jgi:hypothetical protein
MRKSDIELRDWYAGLAMQSLFSVHSNVYEGTDIAERIAEDAFEMAKMMMEQRQVEMIIEMDAEVAAVMASKTE